MNRHSVFLKLNILFGVALLATLIAGFLVIVHIQKKDRMDMMFKSRLIIKEQRILKEPPSHLYEEFQLTPVKGSERKIVLALTNHGSLQQVKKREKRNSIFTYKGDLYLYIHVPGFNVLLRDGHSFRDRFLMPLLILSGTLMLLLAMYVLLRKTLTPLRALQKDIERYGEGKLSTYLFSEKKDEIAEVSNAFYASALKNKRLSESRTLFLRNLFHELNTPVTKGKLLAEIVEDEKTKGLLDRIFSRLSSLLKEIARMEEITSQRYVLSKKQLRIADLIDEAKDLLYFDEPVATNVTYETMEADFASMSIVFKNLMDNALKYGKSLEIICENGTLAFISEGEELKGDFASYLEPFSERQAYSKEGLGLGLYIVSEILRLHDMDFAYAYSEGKNRFTIGYQNNL